MLLKRTRIGLKRVHFCGHNCHSYYDACGVTTLILSLIVHGPWIHHTKNQRGEQTQKALATKVIVNLMSNTIAFSVKVVLTL